MVLTSRRGISRAVGLVHACAYGSVGTSERFRFDAASEPVKRYEHLAVRTLRRVEAPRRLLPRPLAV